jgi:hypothetical protein
MLCDRWLLSVSTTSIGFKCVVIGVTLTGLLHYGSLSTKQPESTNSSISCDFGASLSQSLCGLGSTIKYLKDLWMGLFENVVMSGETLFAIYQTVARSPYFHYGPSHCVLDGRQDLDA